jgi:hypothetical protein
MMLPKRAGLEQQALVRVDGKGGAVRGEAGFKRRGHLGDKSPPQVGGSRQDDFGLKFPGQIAQGRGRSRQKIAAGCSAR